MITRAALAIGLGLALAAPAMAADPIKFRLGHPAAPQSHVVANFLVPWAAKVTKEAEGIFEISVFAGGQLGGNETLLDSAKTGVADIAWVNTAYYSGKFNRLNVGTLPFEVTDSIAASAALWKVYERGLFGDDVTDFKPIAFFALPQSGVAGKEPVRKLEDIRAKKVGTAGGGGVAATEKLGAVPVTIEFTEIYEAFNRGTIQYSLLQYTAFQPLRLWEVAKHHTEVGITGATYTMAMNPASYAKLPPKGKEIFDRATGLTWSREWGKFWNEVEVSGKQLYLKGAGTTVHTLDAAEKKRWQDAIAPITGEWTQKTPNGAAILAAFREERDKEAAQSK
jgi:TRAP-type transport system periplasmic protein